MNYFKIMRPSHWTKNVFVFAALIFGKKLLASPHEVFLSFAAALGGFFCFSLASSAIYIFNDIVDRQTDRLHPEKSSRPIASGEIPVGNALIMSVLCAAVAVIAGFSIVRELGAIIVVYILLMVLYSLLLKRVMILDCVVISIGFCLRAIAGAVVVGVFISPWLVICTFALCLFMSFGKRRSEIEMLGDVSDSFRRTLAGYTPELLAHMIDVTSGLAIVCFLLYTMDDRTLRIFGTNNLVYTTPLVLYCIFRFSALIQKGRFSGPVGLILKDRPFQIGLLLWVISCIAVIYSSKLIDVFGDVWAY